MGMKRNQLSVIYLIVSCSVYVQPRSEGSGVFYTGRFVFDYDDEDYSEGSGTKNYSGSGNDELTSILDYYDENREPYVQNNIQESSTTSTETQANEIDDETSTKVTKETTVVSFTQFDLS